MAARARTLALKTKVEVTGADKLDNLGKRMQRAGTALTVGVTTPLALLSNAAADAASDLNESVNAINVVFGESARKIEAYGETAAEAAGLSQRAFNQLVTPIGAMLQNVGFSADEAADASINLAQRAADMASVFNTDVSEALGAIQAGLRGEADPLERFGVGLSEAAIKAYALENGLAASGAEIDNNVKAQARLGLFLEQTEKIAGDFANTAEEAANAERIMAAEAENAAAKLGQKFLPIKRKVIEILSSAIDAWSSLPGPMQDAIVIFGAAAAALGPPLLVVGSFIRAGTGLIALAPKIGLAFHAMLGPIGLVTAGVALLATAFATDFLGIRTATEDFANDMALNFGDMGDRLHAIADDVGVPFQEIKDLVKETMEETGLSFEAAARAAERELKGIPITADAHFKAYSDVTAQHMLAAKGIVEQGVTDMAAEAGTLPGDMADQLLANQFELTGPDGAIAELVDFMDQALSPAQERFNARAFLASQAYKDALNSGIPSVVKKAEEMAADAAAVLDNPDFYRIGANSAFAFGNGLRDSGALAWVNKSAARVAAAARGIFPGSEPKDPNSPFRGITKGFGFNRVLAAGLERTAGVVTSALRSALPTPMAPAMAVVGAASGGGETHYHRHFNITWQGAAPDGTVDMLVRRLRDADRVSEWGA